MLPLSDLPEVRVLSVTVNAQPLAVEWFETFSSYGKLFRVVARVYRFKESLPLSRDGHAPSSPHAQ